jgi:hypothetical protein
MKYLLSVSAVAAVLAYGVIPAFSQAGTAGPSGSPPSQAQPQGMPRAPMGQAQGGAGTAGPSTSQPLVDATGGKKQKARARSTSGKKARSTAGTAGPSNSPGSR